MEYFTGNPIFPQGFCGLRTDGDDPGKRAPAEERADFYCRHGTGEEDTIKFFVFHLFDEEVNLILVYLAVERIDRKTVVSATETPLLIIQFLSPEPGYRDLHSLFLPPVTRPDMRLFFVLHALNTVR